MRTQKVLDKPEAISQEEFSQPYCILYDILINYKLDHINVTFSFLLLICFYVIK